jgi:hypothetical protein
MKLETRLRALTAVVIEEARLNPAFAARLEAALATSTRGGDAADAAALGRPRRPSNRRAPAPFDPFVVYADGENALRRRLEGLNVEQLKDIVAGQGMDAARLAMKWKSADRLIELIVATVDARSRKGDVFRADGHS